MRVLVTGGAGFIGSHLLTRLVADGHDVASIDRNPLERAEGVTEFQVDLLDPVATRRAFSQFEPEVVVHLAARTDLAEDKHLAGYRDNIEAVETLVSVIAQSPSMTRWICTSSQLVCRVGYTPRDAQDYAPDTLYGESKVRTERIVRSTDGGGVPWVLIRPTTIWGPRMNRHYLRFFSMLRDGRYFQVGNDANLKSYGYVGNTVAQLAALVSAPLEQVHRRTLYVADYEPLSLTRWAEMLRVAMGAPRIRRIPVWAARAVARVGDAIAHVRRDFPFTSFRLRNVLTAYTVDTTPLQAICPHLPCTVEEGVRDTVRWFQQLWRDDAERSAR